MLPHPTFAGTGCAKHRPMRAELVNSRENPCFRCLDVSKQLCRGTLAHLIARVLAASSSLRVYDGCFVEDVADSPEVPGGFQGLCEPISWAELCCSVIGRGVDLCGFFGSPARACVGENFTAID